MFGPTFDHKKWYREVYNYVHSRAPLLTDRPADWLTPVSLTLSSIGLRNI